jgi:hypothetical protein
VLRRVATLIVVAATALAMTAAPALAGSKSFYKESSRAAQTFWTQVDGTPTGAPLGNVHVGELYVYQTSTGLGDVFAWIDDFDCELGKLPGGGGHGFEEEEEEPSGCEYVGSRFAEGYGLSFTVDRKLSTANLSGQLTVFGGGHGEGGVIGTPMANITWTGVGALIKQSSTWTYNDGTTTYTDRYRSTDRNAVMSGDLGPMGFDPELSGGQISRFSSMSKSRTK